jgi:hypothetical protein
MLTNIWFYLALLACAIVLGLAFYAGRLIWLLKQQKITQAQAKKALIVKQNAHDTKTLNSVLIITKAMMAEQCDYAEGCWRLSKLLTSLSDSQTLETQFSSIFALYDKIKHLPILEERKKLDKRKRMEQDLLRMKSEAALADNITEELSTLLHYTEKRISALTVQ